MAATPIVQLEDALAASEAELRSAGACVALHAQLKMLKGMHRTATSLERGEKEKALDIILGDSGARIPVISHLAQSWLGHSSDADTNFAATSELKIDVMGRSRLHEFVRRRGESWAFTAHFEGFCLCLRLPAPSVRMKLYFLALR